MPRKSRVFRYDPSLAKVVEVTRSRRQHRPRYPLAIEALAVYPDQIDESREYDRKHGVPTDYRPDGSPIVSDSRHYYQYRRIHAVHDRKGFSR